MNLKIFCLLTVQIASLGAMEITPVHTKNVLIDTIGAVKALYICHTLLTSLKKAADALTTISATGITPKNAVIGIRELQKGAFITAFRFKYPGVLEKTMSTALMGGKKLNALVAKSSSPEALLLKKYLDVLNSSRMLFEYRTEILSHAATYDWASLELLDTRFAAIGALMKRALISNDALVSAYVRAVVKKNEGTETLASSAWSIFVDSHEHLSALFDSAKLDLVINFIESDAYKQLYEQLHEKITQACSAFHTKSVKKILRITLNNETITLPKELGGTTLSWKQLLAEAKKEAVLVIEKRQIAADQSFVSSETTEYVVIEDPRNTMRIIIYKTCEPEIKKVSALGYHHRVSDLFMMDRAELVTKIATEKKIPLLIANEAARQKTPALTADQYLQYAHDDIFIDKSGRNIPNKTLFCRVVQESGLTKEYFLVWGFLDDGTCYHRGLTFNSSLDESITKLADKTRYDFDFPALEKLEKNSKDTKAAQS